MTIDPNDSQTLYYGTQKVYKTTNAAGNWTSISPDLSNGPYAGNLDFGTVTSIDVSTINSNVIVAGTDDGNVWKTSDGGANWTKISDALPNRWVTKVLASREDVNSLYVTFSGYRYGEDDGHVYKSTDSGENWLDISEGLPDIPINDIVQDQYGNLFLGTDIGVLSSLDDGASWEPFGENMPSVVINDLFIHEASEYMYAATYGRSSYKMDIGENVLGIHNNPLVSGFRMYPNPASKFVTISLDDPSENSSITIYDQLGRIVLNKDIENESDGVPLSLDEFNKGVYYVYLISNSMKFTKKLIIK